MSEHIPFSTFSGFIKSFRPNTFDNEIKTFVENAFSGFFTAPRSGRISAHFSREHAPGYTETGVMAPYLFRRFAGEASFPRGRYYSLSRDEIGNDQRTLLYELLSYTDFERCGPMIVLDGGEMVSPEADQAEKSALESKLDLGSILDDLAITGLASSAIIAVTFDDVDDRGALRPILEAPGVIARMPYQVERVVIDKVIDFRRPDTQRWLVSNLIHGLPNCAFQYGDALMRGLVIGRPRPTGQVAHLYDLKKSEPDLMWEARGDWDRKIIEGSAEFLDILPFLLFSDHGGSPVTEAIAIWLRQCGAAGLIYPSARNSLEVVFRDGEIESSGGWVFVDYRGTIPPRVKWTIKEPDSWTSPVNLLQLEQADNAPYAGSWRLLGRAEATMANFDSGQRKLRRMHAIGKNIRTASDGPTQFPPHSDWKDPLTRSRQRYTERNYKLCTDELTELIDRENLREASSGNSRASEAFFLLGLAQAKLGNHEAAVTAFRSAASINPNASEPHANIGNSLSQLSQFDSAVQSYEMALRINPSDKVALKNLAFARMMSAKLGNLTIAKSAATTSFPESMLHAWSKRAATESLSKEERALFDTCFPSFEAKPVLPLRFAGDASICRRSYYTVCDNRGNDDGTLFWEIMTHWDSASAFYPSIVDSVVHHEELLRQMPSKLLDTNKFLAVQLFKMSRDLILSRKRRLLHRIVIPLEFSQLEIRHVLDLRLPAAQDWLARQFASVQNTLAAKGDSFPNGPIREGLLSGFQYVIPTLIVPELSGNEFHACLGIWLRAAGCNGLVYPSARRDFRVASTSDSVRDFSGWNFVSYIGAPMPSEPRQLLEPRQWLSGPEVGVVLHGGHNNGARLWEIVGRERCERNYYQYQRNRFLGKAPASGPSYDPRYETLRNT